MERKLIDVAKELNLGVGTVVEFLHDKGFDIQNKPIAKVSEAMYDSLTKKFSDSKAEKAKADLMVIGNPRMQQTPSAPPRAPVVLTPSVSKSTQPPVERRTISLTAPPPAPPQPKGDIKIEDKQPVVEVGDEVKTKPTSPEIITRPGVQPPKILGKIDLNQSKRTDEPRRDGSQSRNDQPRRDGSQNRNDQPRRDGSQNPQNRNDQPRRDDSRNPQNRSDQPRRDDSRNPQNRSDQPRRDDSRNPQNRSDQPRRDDSRNPPPVTPPKIIAPVVIPEIEEVVDPEENLIRGEAPALRGLKIQGKIDIDKYLEKEKDRVTGINDRNRKKKRDERAARNRPADGRTEDGRAPIKNTEGGVKPPTTVNGESAADAEKRRRKRKKIPTSGGATLNLPPELRRSGTGNNTSGSNNGTNNNPPRQGTSGSNNNSNNNPSRSGGINQPRQGQGGNNAPRQGQGGGYQGNRPNNLRPAEPAEINQAVIDAKIKETMARLNIGGKNKGQKMRRGKREKFREKEEARLQAEDSGKLQVAEFISVADLASLLDINPTEIIKTCMGLGIFVSINQRLDAELIEVIAGEFDHEVEFISAEEQVSVIEEEPDKPEDLVFRAPVVTIMGHVDHGKTSLLDYVRQTNVASGEAGGITQHIGAYEVKLPDDRRITFLDTPGHEAFTAMRARGAKVTDVAVVIIASDDSIMPQTREAISHAQAAGVPMIFAINKIDKAGADPTRIKQELANMNLLVEEWGGKYQSMDISAKKGEGVDELLEKIMLEAEILDLKANPNKRASGTIIEASLDKGRGYVSKMLVQGGTLKIGDAMVAGENSGKVKAMFNEYGKKVTTAGPSAPVLVLGLNGAPQAGEVFKVMENESEAKEIATKRAQIVREQSARATKRISLDEIGRRLALGTFKELNLIVKGDVDGSVEALSDALLKQSHETVQVNVILKAVGAITESDVMLASASDAIIIGFQVRPSLQARKLAEREGVEVKMYSIIYEAIEEIKMAIEGMLEPTKEEKITSTIEVREVFKISKIGTIAGAYVQDGKVERKNFLRVIRNGIVIFPVKEGTTGTFASLKRFKDDVKEVRSGFECGLMIDNFNDIEIGDFIETYEIIEVKRKL